MHVNISHQNISPPDPETTTLTLQLLAPGGHFNTFSAIRISCLVPRSIGDARPDPPKEINF